MNVKRWLMAVLAVASLAACATQPVRNIEDRPLPQAARTVPLSRIETAIVQAGEARGWRFDRVKPGHLVATLDRRTHTAVADVFFDRSAYSIRYRSSVNLDAGEGTIHRNYNKWTATLSRDIDARLVRLTPE